MQAAGTAARTRPLRWRTRLLVQTIDAASAAEQTKTSADAGRFASGMQADRQSAVIVDVCLGSQAALGKHGRQVCFGRRVQLIAATHSAECAGHYEPRLAGARAVVRHAGPIKAKPLSSFGSPSQRMQRT